MQWSGFPQRRGAKQALLGAAAYKYTHAAGLLALQATQDPEHGREQIQHVQIQIHAGHHVLVLQEQCQSS